MSLRLGVLKTFMTQMEIWGLAQQKLAQGSSKRRAIG